MALIMKVNYNKANKHKYTTIPKDSDIEPGDYVVIKKIHPDSVVGEIK